MDTTRLRRKQKAALLQWIAEGLETDEINLRAAEFKPAFKVNRERVSYYRSTREIEITALKHSGEFNALTTGLALKDERVRRLQQLADLMWKDIAGGFLWLEQVKQLGVGPTAEIIDYEEFNASEVKEFRGVLDDIAKEMGHRKLMVEMSWRDAARRRGYDPDQLFQDMVNAARRRLAESGSGGGVAGSAAADSARTADRASPKHEDAA